jgi:hypothetical protein
MGDVVKLIEAKRIEHKKLTAITPLGAWKDWAPIRRGLRLLEGRVSTFPQPNGIMLALLGAFNNCLRDHIPQRIIAFRQQEVATDILKCGRHERDVHRVKCTVLEEAVDGHAQSSFSGGSAVASLRHRRLLQGRCRVIASACAFHAAIATHVFGQNSFAAFLRIRSQIIENWSECSPPRHWTARGLMTSAKQPIALAAPSVSSTPSASGPPASRPPRAATSAARAPPSRPWSRSTPSCARRWDRRRPG